MASAPRRSSSTRLSGPLPSRWAPARRRAFPTSADGEPAPVRRDDVTQTAKPEDNLDEEDSFLDQRGHRVARHRADSRAFRGPSAGFRGRGFELAVYALRAIF